MRPIHAAALVALSLASCASPRITQTPDLTEVEFEAMIDELAQADVVFLGEEHDKTQCHELQQRVTEALLERHGRLAISMEMFERDAQPLVDLYVNGEVGEEAWLQIEDIRFWPQYQRDYAPAVDLARANGLPLIAANAPRPLARKVSMEGLAAVAGDPHVARQVDSGPGAYRDQFFEAMGSMAGHGAELDEEAIQRMFAAQCVKDDTMAESIADFLGDAGGDPPVVVHWCGRFHSDFGLGTVERLAARRPDLNIAITSCVSEGGPGDDPKDAERADFVWYVTR